MKTVLKKIRRYAFITVNALASVLLVLSVCSVDSSPWISLPCVFCSGLWLFAAAWLWDNTTLFDRAGDE